MKVSSRSGDAAITRVGKESRRWYRIVYFHRVSQNRGSFVKSQVRTGGKARQEMRGGECKGGRTNERAEPLNIHVHRWIERIPLNIQPSMAMIKIIPR